VLLTVCGVFVLTVLLMLASALNPNAGILARLFDRHGVTMLAVEVGAILVVAIIVLLVERRETRRRIDEREAALVESAQRVESAQLIESGQLESERSKSGLSPSDSPSNVPFDPL
jgi:heme/copper-type cytochrome/quinol oxidase subunit 2